MKKFHNIELIPQSSFYKNIRSEVSTKQWQDIRKIILDRDNHSCSICESSKNLEAHELWIYDDSLHIQKLEDILSLCKPCHQVHHLGFAQLQGNFESCLQRLKKTNQLNEQQTYYMVKNVFERWKKRSKHQWKIDMTALQSILDTSHK